MCTITSTSPFLMNSETRVCECVRGRLISCMLIYNDHKLSKRVGGHTHFSGNVAYATARIGTSLPHAQYKCTVFVRLAQYKGNYFIFEV